MSGLVYVIVALVALQRLAELLYAQRNTRALLARGDATVEKQISPDALTSYLLFGSVSEPVTLLEGVFSLQTSV